MSLTAHSHIVTIREGQEKLKLVLYVKNVDEGTFELA